MLDIQHGDKEFNLPYSVTKTVSEVSKAFCKHLKTLIKNFNYLIY